MLLESHQPCIFAECGSSDGLAIYQNEDDNMYVAKCFVCCKSRKAKQLELLTGETTPIKKKEKPVGEMRPRQLVYGSLAERKINKETLKRYGVGVEVGADGKIKSHVYPYYNLEGDKVGQKVRELPKQFMWEGDSKETSLFGMNVFPAGSAKYITITEGELDALSGNQIDDFPWVSVKSSSEAVSNCKKAYHYLMSFEKIVLCFDNDQPGKDAAQKVAKLFPLGKVLICKHKDGYKDASDYLVAGQEQMFMKQVWWKAVEWRPEGIVSSAEMEDRLKNFKYERGADYPFESINEKTYGLRPNELVVIAARRGAGKTTVMRQIANRLIKDDPDVAIGCFFLEEIVERAFLGILGAEMKKPLHHPDVQYTEEEWAEGWDSVMAQGRINMYDEHDGKITIEKLEEYIRFYVKGIGCKYILIDHIGRVKVPSMMKDERRSLDEVGERLSALCVELGVTIISAIHLNREGMIRGSDGIENSASIVIHMNSHLTDDGTRLTHVSVTKNRLYGIEGECMSLTLADDGVNLEEISFDDRDDIIAAMDENLEKG